MSSEMNVEIRADTSAVEQALTTLERLSASFGSQMTGALKSAVVSGRELEDVLRQVGLNLAGMALNQGLKPLQSLITSNIGALAGVLPFAKGGVPGSVVPFAAGGVVSTPTYFQAGRTLGVMGEAGSEAILPLQRGADGRLGVAASGGGASVNVVFNVNAADAASFRKSEAQLTGMLARAVQRGARTL